MGGPGGLRDRRLVAGGDDRLGRALDAVADNVDAIVGSAGAAAIDVFGIDVTRLHWDMTSISLHGAYEDNDPDYPKPGWGHPKDRRPDLKQIQAGIAVSADGAIPVFHQVYDGGAGEIAQVIDAMHALQNLAATPGFLMVGDSKLISYGNVTAMTDAGVRFLAPSRSSQSPGRSVRRYRPGRHHTGGLRRPARHQQTGR